MIQPKRDETCEYVYVSENSYEVDHYIYLVDGKEKHLEKNDPTMTCHPETCRLVTTDCEEISDPILYATVCPEKEDKKEDARVVPKCAYIDPPSVQVGEYLPFWWDLELNTLDITDECTSENT